MLYPILTESRLLSDLSGVWDFKLDNGNGFDEKWYEAPLKDADTMPVPASYNDLKEGADFRDHYSSIICKEPENCIKMCSSNTLCKDLS